MQYMLLIYADPDQPDTPHLLQRYREFTECVAAKGVLRGGHQLQRAPAATSVRVRNGEVLATDGPYAETKEQIGGYYMLECADIEEAVKIAAQIPNAEDGCIEVRPIVDHGEGDA